MMVAAFARRLRSRPRLSRIGIELDGEVVRAAQLRRSSAGWSLLRTTEFTVPAGTSPTDTAGERAGLIRHVLQRRGFEGLELSISLPVGLFQSDLLDISEGKGQEPAEAVRTLFARAMRCAPEGLEVACWPRTGAADSSHVFAVGLSHDVARPFLRPLAAAGLDVAALGCPASALANLAQRSPLAGGPCTAIVRLGYASHLVVLCSGAQVIYQRTLDTPGWSALRPGMTVDVHPQAQEQAVRRHLGAVAEEALSTLECVPRTFAGATVSKVLLSGVASGEPGILELLDGRLEGIEPLAMAGIATGGVEGPASFDIACGAALAEERA
jgi:hypothetical protein